MDEFFLPVQIEPLAEGGYLATSGDLPGLVAQGRTVAETLEIAQDVARKLIESCIEHGDPLPRKIRRALKGAQRKATVRIPIGISQVAA
jgi:predicted RNase H-like HicB family nuclease